MPSCVNFKPVTNCCSQCFHGTIDALKAIPKKAYEVTQKVLDYVLPRNPITQKRELRLIPTCIENYLGTGLYDSLCPKGRISENKMYTTTVQQVFDDIVEQCPRKNMVWEVRVLEDDETVNAFCLPGGKVTITTGLIKKLEQNFKFDDKDEYKGLTFEDNLAAVLGHEIIHAAAGHGARTMQFSLMIYSIGKIFGAVLPELLFKEKNQESQKKKDLFTLFYNAVLWVATKFIHSHNSQQHEFESDKYGIDLVHATKIYNIQASSRLQEIFIEIKNENSQPGVYAKTVEMLSSHPPSRERLAANQANIKRLLGTA